MMSSIRNLRHILVGTCVAALLSGCQVLGPDSDAGQLMQMMRLVLSPQPKVTLEQASAIPYASIGFQVDDGAQGLLVLASDSAGERLWTSAMRISIVTLDGRITKSAGLLYNLGATYSSAAHQAAQYGSIARTVDFPDLRLFGVDIVCKEQKIGPETITLLGKAIQTERSEEHCQSDTEKMSWHFTNRFWRDPQTGFVWRSEQHIHPRLGVITLETLRPPEQ